MTLKIACSYPTFTYDLCGKADFVFLMKAHVSRKKINLPMSYFVNYVMPSVSIIIWLKSKRV